MRTVVAVFSATGNCEYAAGYIKDAETVSINKNEDLPEDCERLGIITPVYYGTVPYPVRRWIKDKIAPRDNSDVMYLFGITTYGGIPLWASTHLSKALSDAGIEMSYSGSVKMPNAFLPLFPEPQDERTVEKIMAKANIRLERIADDVEKEVFRPARYPLLYRIFGRKTASLSRPGRNEDLKVDSYRCTECGKCATICPMGNIEMTDRGPVHHDMCIKCFACYHFCPQNAVTYPRAKGQYKKLQ